MSPQLEQQIERSFSHEIPDRERTAQHVTITACGKTLAMTLARSCPAGRELSLALTNLEQAILWANAAIANGKKPPEGGAS